MFVFSTALHQSGTRRTTVTPPLGLACTCILQQLCLAPAWSCDISSLWWPSRSNVCISACPQQPDSSSPPTSELLGSHTAIRDDSPGLHKHLEENAVLSTGVSTPVLLMQRWGEDVLCPGTTFVLGYHHFFEGKMGILTTRKKKKVQITIFKYSLMFFLKTNKRNKQTNKNQCRVSTWLLLVWKRETDENHSRFASLDNIIHHSKGKLQTVVLI